MRRRWPWFLAILMAGLGAILVARGGEGPDPGTPAPVSSANEPACAPQQTTDTASGEAAGSAPGQPDQPGQTESDEPLLGLNDSAFLVGQIGLQATLQLDRELGASLWRLPLDWGGVERKPGKFDFSRYDPIYCAAIASGVAPIWHLTGIPPRASNVSCKVPCLHPPAKRYLDRMRRFAKLASIRYPRSAAFEGWNEPNLQRFWGGAPNPERYVKVLKATYEGVKDGNPQMTVLGGSLANVEHDGARKLSLQSFIRRMAGAGGFNYLDGFSLHAYPYGPIGSGRDRFTTALTSTQGALASAGQAAVPIWITEVGAPTLAGAFVPQVSAAEQASILTGAYREARRSGQVAAFLVHTLIDPIKRVTGGPGFGLFTKPDDAGRVTPKPAACALRQIASTQRGCPEGLGPPSAG